MEVRVCRQPKLQIRGGFRILAVPSLLIVGFLLQISPAYAHATLIATNPGSGAKLTTAPTVVALSFDNPVLSLGAAMEVTGPTGSVSTGSVTVAGTSLSRPLRAALPAGTYTTIWRVTTNDGHPISGSFSFSLLAGTGTGTGVGAGTVTASAGSQAPTPSAQAVGVGSRTEEEHSGHGLNRSAHPDSDTLPTGVVALGYLILAVAVVTAVLTERARRKRRAATPPVPSSG